MPQQDTSSRAFYNQRVESFQATLARWRRLDRGLSRLRLVLFLLIVGAFLAAGTWQNLATLWFTLAALFALVFLWAARRQERVIEDRDRAELLLKRYQRSLARLDRRWADLPERPFAVPDDQKQFATDLDLFGHGSLFQLIDETHTTIGRNRLAQWLLEPSSAPVVARRYAALEELAAARELREELYWRSSALARSLADPAQFVRWASSPPWYSQCRLLRWVIPISSATVVAAVVGWLVSPSPIWLIAGLIAVAVNAVIMIGWGGQLYAMFNQVSTRHGEASQYRELFALLQATAAKHNAVSKWLVEDESFAFAESDRAWKQLEYIVVLSSLRQAGLLSILHALLQPTLMWDFHVCRLLDRWKTAHGRHVSDWFAGLGAYEALCSLAVLRDDHPDWCRPQIISDAEKWEGIQVGHPLLPDKVRQCNDVTVGGPGTVLLVTGSNMSGKSTLLRAIGVNTVLAQAGSPVCARSLSLPPLVIATSMRIQDSLEAGVSFYLAELQRLKQIVDLASALQKQPSGPRLLYLLDEILQGTNSRERHIAVAHVVAHLIETRAIGAISTHDLELASSPLLRDAVRAVHFRESFREGPAGREMVFDYRLRDGVATTTNALTLLEMVGLADRSEFAEE